MRIVLLVLIALASAGTALAAERQSATVTSGLYGHVLSGPTSPNCATPDPGCYAPVQTTLVFSHARSGAFAARITSTASGYYRAKLPHGYYTVRPSSANGGKVKPSIVWVRPDTFRKLNFVISTGIY